MTTSSSSRALWLLERAGVDDALVGDIAEGYCGAASQSWLWRQVVVAILARGRRDLVSHKALALRALSVGWIAQYALGRFLRESTWYWRAGWGWKSELWLDRFVGFAVLPPPILLANVVGALSIGWLVSRLHRPRGFSMGLVYAGSVLIFMFGGLANSFERGLRPFERGFPAGASFAFETIFSFGVVPMLLVVGALYGNGRIRSPIQP